MRRNTWRAIALDSWRECKITLLVPSWRLSMTPWKDLLVAVKAACLVGLWSKGSALARDGAVVGKRRDADACVFRVRASGRGVAPTVTLYRDDVEWECDCGSNFDPCEHVVACVVAIASAADGGDALFGGTARSIGVRYDLRSGEEGLSVTRTVVLGAGGEHALASSLADFTARRGGGGDFAPTRADLAIDRLLGRSLASPLSFDKAVTLLRALVATESVTLDGAPVRVSAEPVYPRARVVDAEGGGVELIIETEPEVTRVVAPGVLLRGDTIHPFGARDRFGQRWERLPFRRVFTGVQITELVSTVIPELERHISVELRTSRLPRRGGELSPWIRFEIDFVDQGVDVLPLLVYGDPPQARVDRDRLVHLRGAVPRRQPALEIALLRRLREELNLVPGRRVHFESADAARFLAALESFPDGRDDGGSPRSATSDRRVDLTAKLVARDEDFELVFEAPHSGGRRGTPARAGAAAVVAAWRDGIGVVSLDDGRFGSVPADWLARYGDLVADLLAAREQNHGRMPKAASTLLGELCDALETPEPMEVSRLRSLLDGIAPNAEDSSSERRAHAVPAGFRGELRGYQGAGVAWLARLRDAGLGGILADDMGLGKTVQTLCVLRGRSLVVCPRSVIYNWTNEIKRFRPDLRVALYHGANRLISNADVTLTTYATLRNDVETLREIEWDCVVLDESQQIKNPDSQVARAAYQLRAGFRLSLSGTPIENRLDELWSQMHFVNRGLLGGRRDFVDRYERPMIAGDGAVAERLRRRIRPFVLRRLKKEVATELPPRTDSVLMCELEPTERVVYDAVRLAARADLVRQLEGGGSVMAAFEVLLRLRQAACHTGLLPGRSEQTSSKVEALLEALDDVVADGHKALVFSQWTSLLDRVEPHLESHSIDFVRLDGSTRDRGAVVDGFQADDGPPVLLVSLKAGGTGLNLTAADHVFLLDPWWNPAVEEQAADRAHRIGQDRPVMVYRLVAKDTVEERVLELQQRKRALADAALSGGDLALAASITREDILALLD